MSIPPVVLKDACAVLEELLRSLHTKEFSGLERLSNKTIHNASINQDIVSISISKIVFGIYKIEEKSYLKSIPFPADKLVFDLTRLHDALEKGQVSVFEEYIQRTILLIEKIANDFHLSNVINRAGVKKGGKLYEHGISIAQSAKAMNVSQWELYDYVGKSNQNNYSEDIDKRVAKRLIYTERLFQE